MISQGKAKFYWIGLVLMSLLLNYGCALNNEGRDAVSTAWERHHSARAERSAAYARLPTTQPSHEKQSAATQPFEQYKLADRLREYIILALENNPDIERAEQVARARAEVIPQLTSLPDPVLSTRTLPEPVRTAEGDNFFILGVTQKLLAPEKLTRAGRRAFEATEMAIADWEKTRLRVIADVKRAYFRLYTIDRSIEITQNNQELMEGLIDAVRGQVAAGMRRQEDLLRAQVEFSRLESELIEFRRQRRAAEAMLNSLLDRPTTTVVPSPEPFDIRKTENRLKTLFAQAAEASPRLQRLKNQIERDRHAVRLAELEWWPDFNLGFQWIHMDPRPAFKPPVNPQTGRRPPVSKMSENGSDNWAITFGFNLPIWFDKIQGGIREARAQLNASMYEYADEKNRVYFEVEDALAQVESQEELARLFETTIIPQARQAYEVSRAGYMAGRSDFQYVIDNWRKWLTFKIQYHRSIGQLEQGVADLEQAIGMSLTKSQTKDTQEQVNAK